MNFEFQIIQINKKLNVEKYIENLIKIADVSKNMHTSGLYNEYFTQLKISLEESNIYTKEFFICISYNGKIEDVERILNKLSKLGLVIERITDTLKLKNILYCTLNKCY